MSFRVSESASGKQIRKTFNELLSYADKNKVSIILCEKIDRLTRNLKDAASVSDWINEDSQREVHFVKESFIVNKNTRAHENLVWDMKVTIARFYTNNLSEEVKKGQKEKIAQGWCPTRPIVGYKTVGEKGHKIHIIDEEKAPLVRKMFELYATGNYSMRLLAKEMAKRGLTNQPSGLPVSTSQIEQILKNPFYYGVMRVKGKLYPHKYEPLISLHLFNKVEQVIASYNKKNFKRTNKPYIFRGLITCKKCGYLISPEIKKGKYVYYHCTNYHGNCDNVVWIKEEEFLEQIKTVLQGLKLKPWQAEELKSELRAIHEAEKVYYEKNLGAIKNKLETIDRRLKIMYEDRLDGRITTDEYDKTVKAYKSEQQRLLMEYEEHSQADENFYIIANKLIELSSRAWELFESSELEEKQQLLNFLLQNSYLQGKNALFELKNPFSGILEYAKSGSLLRTLNEIRTFFSENPNAEF